MLTAGDVKKFIKHFEETPSGTSALSEEEKAGLRAELNNVNAGSGESSLGGLTASEEARALLNQFRDRLLASK